MDRIRVPPQLQEQILARHDLRLCDVLIKGRKMPAKHFVRRPTNTNSERGKE